MTTATDTPVFVTLPSTPEQRAERMAFVHRATRPGKPHKQLRSNDRRKAITESRETLDSYDWRVRAC